MTFSPLVVCLAAWPPNARLATLTFGKTSEGDGAHRVPAGRDRADDIAAHAHRACGKHAERHGTHRKDADAHSTDGDEAHRDRADGDDAGGHLSDRQDAPGMGAAPDGRGAERDVVKRKHEEMRGRGFSDHGHAVSPLVSFASRMKSATARAAKMIACARWSQNQMSAPCCQIGARLLSPGQTSAKKTRRPIAWTTMPGR